MSKHEFLRKYPVIGIMKNRHFNLVVIKVSIKLAGKKVGIKFSRKNLKSNAKFLVTFWGIFADFFYR